MRVYLGPYKSWIGPYQLAEKVLFWKEKWNDKDSDAIYALGDLLDKVPGLTKLCQWVHSKKKRRIKVVVHNYDVWSMDHTLALIIVPMLKKLKENKHGSPTVDDEDVPEHLRSTSAPALSEDQKDNGHTDDNWEKRWDWVLDEMIWAFEQHADDDWEDQYYSGKANITLTANNEIVDSGDFKVDREGMKKHTDRMDNGRRLFAKYYNSLWD